MNFDVLDKVFDVGLKSAIPEGELTISKWAATYRHVSLDRVADPSLAGLWKNERTPYLVGIMDAVTEPNVNEILFLKSSQVGGSELINNVLGYYIHIDPATIQYICENEGKARAWSVESFAPMIRDTPALAAIFGEARQRDSTNMIESKAFRGGHFALGWATSPATLSSRPRRVIATDETDAFESTKEGDPVKLAEARTKTAGAQRKIIHVTTPRDKETSRVLPLWEDSSQEKFFVPCPECGEFQILLWTDGQGFRIQWENDNPHDAYYVCASGCQIFNESKEWMLARGEWRSLNPNYQGNRRAFWINELYSPFTTWSEMAVAFLEAKKHRDTLKVFVNTRLAEFWEESGEEIEFADLTFLREKYEAEVPRGVLVLTAGVDIQDDRIEIEVVGWGRDFENWSIDYKVIEGSPGLFEVWDDLSDYLLQEFEGEDGKTYKISAAAIDTGGHHTDKTYNFVKANKGRRWHAVKGANVYGQPIVSKPKIVEKNGVKVRLFHVGTDTAKDEIFSYLRVSRDEESSGDAQPGFCHFPADYEESYFKQLCAEKKITQYRMGVARQVYVKVSANARNEALDCRVYATAARAILNPNFEKLAQHRFRNEVKQEIREKISRKMAEIAEKTGEEIPDSLKEKLENLDEKPKKRRIIVKNSPFAGRPKRNFAAD